MSQCDFCYKGKPLLDSRSKFSAKGDFYPGIEICIAGEKLNVACIADTYEPNCTEAGIKINYCPMCGRNLVKAVNADGRRSISDKIL